MLLFLPATSQARVYYREPGAAFEGKETLKITFFNVGEGDAMLLSCGGEYMMIDGGPNPFRERMKNALEAWGITRFKYFLNTHYHDDHINGLYHLMRYGFSVDEFLHPYTASQVARNELADRAVKQAHKMGIPDRQVGDGTVLTLGNATLRLYRYMEITNANARSLMTMIHFGDARILLCADIIGRTQQYFADTMGDELKADIVKGPHHGITPMNVPFLEAVSPELAVITSDRSDVPKAAHQLEERGVTGLYSGDGNVFVETDGVNWYAWQTPGDLWPDQAKEEGA